MIRIGVILPLSLGLLAESAQAEVWDDLLAGRLDGGGVTAPLYERQAQVPYAVLRARGVRTEWEQRGFFRIGLLPRVVLEHASLDLAPGREPAATPLASLCRLLESERRPPRPIELRGFVLRRGTNAPPLLEAAAVRVDARGARLFQLLVRQPTGPPIQLDHARLKAGEDGTVWLESATQRHRLEWADGSPGLSRSTALRARPRESHEHTPP